MRLVLHGVWDLWESSLIRTPFRCFDGEKGVHCWASARNSPMSNRSRASLTLAPVGFLHEKVHAFNLPDVKITVVIT